MACLIDSLLNAKKSFKMGIVPDHMYKGNYLFNCPQLGGERIKTSEMEAIPYAKKNHQCLQDTKKVIQMKTALCYYNAILPFPDLLQPQRGQTLLHFSAGFLILRKAGRFCGYCWKMDMERAGMRWKQARQPQKQTGGGKEVPDFSRLRNGREKKNEEQNSIQAEVDEISKLEIYIMSVNVWRQLVCAECLQSGRMRGKNEV